jgi:putative ABC transport system permease protein
VRAVLDAPGEDIALERPERVLLAVDDQHLCPAQHEPELLVRVAVQRHDRARLELDQVQHRPVAEQRPPPDPGGELERRDVLEANELRLHRRCDSYPILRTLWFDAPVFYLRYLRNELLRRSGRTIVTLLGLGIGVALVITISSLSTGLDKAQKKTLDPLAGIGTDLTVTLSPQQSQGGGGFVPGGGGGGGNRDVLQANQSVVTDLSKLGEPGDHFVHDFFLPGTQLTFKQNEAQQIASLANVAEITQGLTLIAEHQEGVVPKIVATLKTGGQTFDVQRNIPRPTAAQFEKMQACLQKLNPQGGAGGAGGGGFGTPRARGGANSDAAAKCLPASLRKLRTQFTTPRETLKQVLDPPQTNITTTSYTIGGVDQTHPEMGVVTTSQVAKGRFLSVSGGREALVSETYAAKHNLKLGSKLDLNGTSFTVIGLVNPPLGGQSADVYLPLKQLQKLAGQQGLANVVLVRASDSSKVGAVQNAIKTALPQAQVASSKQVADKISGSLVDASNLSHDLGLALSIIAAAAAFLLAALLALASIGKRVRELGTLKALGWTQRMVVRQIAGESLAQGILGGVLGIALGIGAAIAINVFGPSLSASSRTGTSDLLGVGAGTVRTATSSVSLNAPISVSVLALGFGLALLGGLIAGSAGAFRAARLRPADALRHTE